MKGKSGLGFVLAIVVVVIAITLIANPSILLSLGMGATLADSVSSVTCTENAISITIVENGKASKAAEESWCFTPENIANNFDNCLETWNKVKTEQPTMTLAKWGNYDISEFYGEPAYAYTMSGAWMCTNYIGGRGELRNYLYDNYNEADSSSNEANLRYTFEFAIEEETPIPEDPEVPVPDPEPEIIEEEEEAIVDTVIDGIEYQEIITTEDVDEIDAVIIDGEQVETLVVIDSEGKKHLVINTSPIAGLSETEVASIILIVMILFIAGIVFVLLGRN